MKLWSKLVEMLMNILIDLGANARLTLKACTATGVGQARYTWTLKTLLVVRLASASEWPTNVVKYRGLRQRSVNLHQSIVRNGVKQGWIADFKQCRLESHGSQRWARCPARGGKSWSADVQRESEQGSIVVLLEGAWYVHWKYGECGRGLPIFCFSCFIRLLRVVHESPGPMIT